MRWLGLTDCNPGPGRGALRRGLLVLSALAALVLAAVLGGKASPVGGLAPGERAGAERLRSGQAVAALFQAADGGAPLAKPQSTERGVLARGAGDASALHLHRPVSPPRGRTGFAPDPQAIQRAVRARYAAIVEAMGLWIRWSSAPVAEGHAADRPTIVIRPLRGPPAPG